MTPAPSIPLAAHLGTVAQRLLRGRVVPFLGAGVNLCEREPGQAWVPGVGFPSGGELARHLHAFVVAQGHDVPDRIADDLVRISQYIAVMIGNGPLYEELHSLFHVECPATRLHDLLADLAAPDGWARPQLVVTTNYDTLLEQAYEARGVPYDLLMYVARGPDRGLFVHTPPDGPDHVITDPDDFDRLPLDDRRRLLRPALLKIHGAVRADEFDDSYVITEDDYIYHLTRRELVPAWIREQMSRAHFLFTGYGLRDWNLRVLLHRVWGQEKLDWPSWAVQLGPTLWDQKLWAQHGVEIIDHNLGDYVTQLRQALDREAAS